MSCITRCVLRWGLVSGLALGGLTLLIGPERVGAGISQIRAQAQSVVDGCVDDPVALKRQLEQLADQYPDRIEQVRGELGKVDYQLAQIDSEVEIARRVVAYTSEDLTVLQTRLARADEEVRTRLASTGHRNPNVFIRFEGVRFNLDEARAEAIRIGNVREQYRDRIAADHNQKKLLTQQRQRLAEILDKLENDFGTYQAKLWSLDRQIDAIERNDQLIELIEEQQETLAGYDRYTEVASLKQLEAKLAQMQMEQEARLEMLSKHSARQDYESKARQELDAGNDIDFEIELDVESDEDTNAGSVAFADRLAPIVIE